MKAKYFLVSAFLVTFGIQVQAQINGYNDIGQPARGAYVGSNIDNVQMANGNLHIEIPLHSVPGRKIDLNFRLSYDSKSWELYHQVLPDGSESWTKMLSNNNSQWILASGGILGTVRTTWANVECTSGSSCQKKWIVFHEETGAAHPFPEFEVKDGIVQGPLEYFAMDGSGWKLKLKTDGYPDKVLRKDGHFIQFESFGMVSVRHKDTNGNFVSKDTTDANYMFDTVGRRFPANPLAASLSYLDSNGINRVINLPRSPVILGGEVSGQINPVSRIELPNGQTYTFTYQSNSYGQVASVALPTGGSISYTYDNGDNGGPRVTSRTVTNGGQSATWYYTWGGTIFTSEWQNIVRDPVGNETVYTCRNIPNLLYSADYPSCSVVRVDHYTGLRQSGALLKSVLTDYTTSNGFLLPIRETLVLQGGLQSKSETAYEYFTFNSTPVTAGNVTRVDEYGFGSGQPGSLIRYTTTSYAHWRYPYWDLYWELSVPNIINRPLVQSVFDGSGVKKAETKFEYDGNPLTSTSSAPNHDYTNYSSSNTARGNLSQVQRWRNTDGTYLNSFSHYDDLGNLRSQIDPAGRTTSFNYADDFSSSTCVPSGANTQAYLTLVTNALGHNARNRYYACSGLIYSKRDQNDINASRAGASVTYDLFNRPLVVDFPDGGRTTKVYNDSARWTQTKVLREGTAENAAIEYSDYLGRVWRSVVCEDGPGCSQQIKVDLTFDLLGRKATATNPYRATTETSFGVTSFEYDALNRTKKITNPDGTFRTWNYDGNTTTATDEIGVAKWSRNDAIGRMDAVAEYNTGATYYTYYAYDTLDNLLSVQQRGNADPSLWRNRSFTYNSLSQLLTANNPESGLISYTYDLNGNAEYKTDARAITTRSYFDALNRLYQRTYTNGQYTENWTYDAPDANKPGYVVISNPIGRLVRETNNVNASRYLSYDAMGRVLTQYDFLPSYTCPGSAGWCNLTTATYNKAGERTSLTYPSGRKIVEGYDTAGRLKSVQMESMQGTPVNHTYWSVPAANGSIPGFHANGQPQIEDFGNTLKGFTGLNNRNWTALASVDYGVDSIIERGYVFQGNGNVLTISDVLNSGRTQTFTYDPLNRIKTAQSNATTGSDAWGQSYTIDAWSNLNNKVITKGSAFPFSAAANSANRLVGYSYDSSGNLLNDGLHAYTFDANSRITTVDGQATTYIYDASGNRVRKTTGAAFTEYIYWGSTPIAERNAAGEWTDYIFANGKRVAKADTFEDGILISGNNCTNCGAQVSAFDYPNGSPLSSYVIRSGDKLLLGQYSNSNARGGMVLFFTDGTNTAWSLLDQDSQYLNSDQITGWHWRRANLNAYVGKTINGIRYTADSGTLAGDWAMVFRDVVINSSDGAVRPIYTGENTVSLNVWGSPGSTRQFSIRHLQNVGWHPPTTTTYYHGDHLGSSSKLTAHGGWAVWEGIYAPYGEGVNPRPQNHYLFTGKERDAESGLDYFGARYYANVMGRFATPDWSESPVPIPFASLQSPQTFNLYSYGANNPMKNSDPTGHLCISLTTTVTGESAGCGDDIETTETGDPPYNPATPSCATNAAGTECENMENQPPSIVEAVNAHENLHFYRILTLQASGTMALNAAAGEDPTAYEEKIGYEEEIKVHEKYISQLSKKQESSPPSAAETQALQKHQNMNSTAKLIRNDHAAAWNRTKIILEYAVRVAWGML